MNSKISFAIIGTGHIAHMHAKAILQNPGAELKSVCSRTVDGARAFAEVYQVQTYTDDFDSIIADQELDALIIATPNVFHAPMAKRALAAGKHVLIEKPMAMNTGEALEIAAKARDSGKRLMIGHMWRFDEEVQNLKKILDAGSVGEIVKTKGYGIHENWGPEGWFTQKKLAGGGALIDMGVHAIDTVRFLLNDPEPVSVFASISTRFQDMDVDDTGILMITWDNDTVSIIESGWWHPHMDGPEAGTQLFGTLGYAQLFPTHYKVMPEDTILKIPVPEKQSHCDQQIYDNQVNQFVQDIMQDKACIPGAEEGICIMRIVDAAYQSSKNGQVVRFDT